MTQSQVDFWKLQEAKRHNVEQERETALHDTIDENLKAQDLSTKRTASAKEWGYTPAPIEGMRTGGQLRTQQDEAFTIGNWQKSAATVKDLSKAFSQFGGGVSLLASLL